MIAVDLHKSLPGFDLRVAFEGGNAITALFGRSGSGKSLTLGLIAGLARPDGGHVRIGDDVLVDIARGIFVPPHRRRIGVVFQDAQLFPHLSVRRNLLFGRWFAGRHPLDIGFDAVVETLGIGALLERRPAQLSGGERQRVAMGRAMLANPRLLLMDEPLAALDRPRKLDILPLIERLRDEFRIPVIYVSHAAEEVVRLAASVVTLENGRVVATGSPENVLAAAAPPEGRRFGLFSVVSATVGERDAAFDLTALDHPAGRLWLAGQAGAAGRPVRALVRATDVTLAPGQPGPLSTRSMLAGRVTAITPDGPLASVELSLPGGGTLLALVTRRAVHDLRLAVGTQATALIKTVALDEGGVPHG